jgi:hypothetical protein
MMAMKRSHKMTTVVNLTEMARAGLDGAHWYEHASAAIEAVCDAEGWPTDVFIDVLAITSPRVQVKRNWKLAVDYMRNGGNGYRPKGILPAVAVSLTLWEKTGTIRGAKTGAFASALKGNRDAVVLDVWMSRALGVKQEHFSRLATWRSGVSRVRKVAAKLGIAPAQAQAAIWTAIVRQSGATPGAFNPG